MTEESFQRAMKKRQERLAAQKKAAEDRLAADKAYVESEKRYRKRQEDPFIEDVMNVLGRRLTAHEESKLRLFQSETGCIIGTFYGWTKPGTEVRWFDVIEIKDCFYVRGVCNAPSCVHKSAVHFAFIKGIKKIKKVNEKSVRQIVNRRNDKKIATKIGVGVLCVLVAIVVLMLLAGCEPYHRSGIWKPTWETNFVNNPPDLTVKEAFLWANTSWKLKTLLSEDVGSGFAYRDSMDDATNLRAVRMDNLMLSTHAYRCDRRQTFWRARTDAVTCSHCGWEKDFKDWDRAESLLHQLRDVINGHRYSL